MRKLILVLLLLISSLSPIYASWISDFFTGDSQDKRNERASQALESLINDGTLSQGSEGENFVSIIGSTLDMVLISIRTALSPSITNLTLSSSLDKPKAIDKSSFLGMLIYSFIILECFILGMESLISGSVNLTNILKKILSIVLVLLFIAFLPIICDAILNLFTSAGIIMSGNTNFNAPTTEHPFTYMPSDTLYTLNICKKMLAVEHLRIGGYELGTLIPHFFVNVGEFIITIPFILLMLMIVFWYVEMFLIFTAGYLSLPFTIFSKTEITNYKTILKSMLMQGIKISIGIFLSTFVKDIIINCLKMLDSSFTSTIHAVLFAIFITIIIFFIISKGTSIILNAISGSACNDSKSPLSFSTGVVAGSLAGLAKSISSFKKNNSNDNKLNHNKEILENTNEALNNKNTPSSSCANKNKVDNIKNNNDCQVIPSSEQQNSISSIKGYGEVTALATRDRINAARLEMQNEGITNPSEEAVVAKAKNDAIISKLIKMEKKGFMLENGVYNKPAAEQLKRLREKNE